MKRLFEIDLKDYKKSELESQIFCTFYFKTKATSVIFRIIKEYSLMEGLLFCYYCDAAKRGSWFLTWYSAYIKRLEDRGS